MEIKRETHTIDAKGMSLGRMATKIALLLQGKHKTDYQPHLDAGDNVIVKNFDQIKFTGTKEKVKKYFHYSGYPGGMKSITLEKLFEKSPEKVLFLAVSRMLPKNKLQARMMKRLKIEK
ncbi:MAG: 50S ribosomal protein L13 [Candidatus Paceibacterota bacterium]|jgi:large subunit ribosomal protein L13|nr:50S ribosomal protein L13 [Candidatus Paceibacterota bacterium]MDD5621212.1 50S ribosomal protein L13 [Candidatus Paceibacterota bacterium]